MTLILAMFLFSLTMSISPGPVNMVIISSGASYGFRRTFPFVSGATIGFTLLLIVIGFGFYASIEKYPLFFKYLNVAGSAFIIYIGYKIASSRSELSLTKSEAPSFTQGFLLQWLNPKAWIACASGVVLFSEPSNNTSLIIFIIIYFIVCYLSLAAWAVLGKNISTLLNSIGRIRAFNFCMGGILITTAFYMFLAQ
ncbi:MULTISPECIES: LysE family translocator [Enterobacteriaceae]|jgi:threonine/homoserine/homoserine lactone efflux protein|nr:MULTISPECIES: LysE family translocator [Enterobacteriaceae]MCK4229834.1 LysE family translocator [Enterobacter asburiae]HEC2094755.1 LysE family translocator [Klebsiella oxytoca]AMH11638.1 LysE family translocator [Klebsiella aerogenes]ATY07093.1 LysE family translocator [Klebsiella aerogenes]AXY30106.1 LysE family translocator [Klebsiella aerogenes]